MFKCKAVCQMNFFQLSFVTKCLLTQNAQTSIAPITFIYIYVYVYIYISYHIYIYIYIYDITYYVSSLTVIVIIFYKMLCIIYYNIFIYIYIIWNVEPNTQHEIGNPIGRDEGLSTKATVTDEGGLQGSFCSKTVFNLNQRVLSEIEIQVLEKALDFAPIQESINEPEQRKDFEDFFTRLRIRRNFKDQPSEHFF